METSVNNELCAFILVRGANQGKPCLAKVSPGLRYCLRHARMANRAPKVQGKEIGEKSLTPAAKKLLASVTLPVASVQEPPKPEPPREVTPRKVSLEEKVDKLTSAVENMLQLYDTYLITENNDSEEESDTPSASSSVL